MNCTSKFSKQELLSDSIEIAFGSEQVYQYYRKDALLSVGQNHLCIQGQHVNFHQEQLKWFAQYLTMNLWYNQE